MVEISKFFHAKFAEMTKELTVPRNKVNIYLIYFSV